MALKIRSETLTTCRVATDGSKVELEFLDVQARQWSWSFRSIKRKPL